MYISSQSQFNRRRLSNTLEARSRYSTLDPDRFSEAVKLPALNSINKSVKYNDISFSFSKDLNKLRKEPEADPSLAESMAHSSLLTVRKRYDNLNKQREQFEAYLRDLERQKQKFTIQKQRFESQKQGGKAKVQTQQTTLRELKTQIEQSEMEKKVMTTMISRLRHDKVIYDQLKYNAEKQLQTIAKHRKMIVKEDKLKREEEDRTRKVYQKMVDHLEEEYGEREKHIGSVEGMIDQKVRAYEGSQVKKEQMKEVAENTLAEKDKKEKSWYKVYLCHRLVQRMLQDKMDRQMVKFSEVELAYKNIKTATGVNTAQSLIYKFLNKESQYGALLAQITQEESKIVELKTESDSLNSQRRKLKAQRDALTASKHGQTDLSKEQKAYEQVNSKASSCYLLEEKIKTFLDRTLKKYKTITSDPTQVQAGNKVLETFQRCLEILKAEVEAIGQGVEGDDIDLDEEVKHHKNVRVYIDQQKEGKRKTDKHHNRESTTQFNQEDFINDLRLETLKNNEKFMRQIKKKHEQLRKLKIEAEPKRKEPQAQKSKPVQQV